MLFGRQDNSNNLQTSADEKHSEYVSSLGGNDSEQAVNPALPPDDSIFMPTNTPSPSTSTTDDSPVHASEDESAKQDTTVEPSLKFNPAETNPETEVSVAQPEVSNDLAGLKQEALDHLTPLVDHLEQSPEEKFRTTMMMIQSTDNQALIKDAFAAAKEIQNDKARAQALLDVINEINYFTQKTQQ